MGNKLEIIITNDGIKIMNDKYRDLPVKSFCLRAPMNDDLDIITLFEPEIIPSVEIVFACEYSQVMPIVHEKFESCIVYYEWNDLFDEYKIKPDYLTFIMPSGNETLVSLALK